MGNKGSGIINLFDDNSDDGYISSNSGNSLSSGSVINNLISKKIKSKIKNEIFSKDCSDNGTYLKKLIYKLELNNNNFERYGTYILYNKENNIDSDGNLIEESIDIYNNINDYGYIYIDLKLGCGNYIIDYIYNNDKHTCFNLFITQGNNEELTTLNNITQESVTSDINKTRNLDLFYLSKDCQCLKLIIYFKNKSFNEDPIRLYSLKLYKIYNLPTNTQIHTLKNNIILNPTDSNIISDYTIDICGTIVYDYKKPIICLEQQYKKVKQEVLYEFNFANIQDKKCDFNICGVDLGYTYNNKGLFVKANNNNGYIMFKKPLLCNERYIIIDLDIKSLGGITGKIFLHNGKSTSNVLTIGENIDNVKYIVDLKTPDLKGIFYFILQIINPGTTINNNYEGLILGNLRISELKINVVDKYDHKETESQLEYTSNTAPNVPTIGPIVPTIGPIETGGDTIESLANIQNAILKLL